MLSFSKTIIPSNVLLNFSLIQPVEFERMLLFIRVGRALDPSHSTLLGDFEYAIDVIVLGLVSDEHGCLLPFMQEFADVDDFALIDGSVEAH